MYTCRIVLPFSLSLTPKFTRVARKYKMCTCLERTQHVQTCGSPPWFFILYPKIYVLLVFISYSYMTAVIHKRNLYHFIPFLR